MKKIIPYPFQVKGINRVENKFNGRGLIADEMGLGKTLTTLLSIKWFLETGPAVVVCPATLKENWRRECRRHLDMIPVILEGRTPPALGLRKDPNKIYIINFDILGDPTDPDSWVNYLKAVNPTFIAIDECHAIKTRDAKRTKSVRHLCIGVPRVFMISGTPMTNRPAELWPALNILRPDIFSSFYSFGSRFCNPRKTPWGWDYRGAANLEELHDLLNKTCMIRRLKKDVLKDLPSKTRTVIPLEISNRKEYTQAENFFLTWLRKQSKSRAKKAERAERLVKIGELKRLAARLKLPGVIQWVSEYLEESDGKLLLFGIHKAVIDPLFKKFEKLAVRITGDTPKKDRYTYIDRFNNNPSCRLMIGNVQAAGVGWSCTSASTVAFAEMAWTPGEMTQAEDRIHGIGRGTGVPGSFYYLVGTKTIEDKLVNVLHTKQQNLSTTLDGHADASGFDVLDKLEQILLASKKVKV